MFTSFYWRRNLGTGVTPTGPIQVCSDITGVVSESQITGQLNQDVLTMQVAPDSIQGILTQVEKTATISEDTLTGEVDC